MITNEERRIVAAKLRKIKPFEDDEDEGISWCDVDEVRETLGIYYDYDPCICEAEKVKRLADLIDRPTTKREGGDAASIGAALDAGRSTVKMQLQIAAA